MPIASSTVQIFSASRFSTTMAECTSAVPVSQGSRRRSRPGPRTSSHPSPARSTTTRSQARCACQEAPGADRPGPHPAPPGCIDTAFQQGRRPRRRTAPRSRHSRCRESADGSEAGILQQRVHSLAVHWRRPDAVEGVRGGQAEQLEAGCGATEHGNHARAQPGRQVAAERRDGAPAQREDQAPEQDRALVVAPDPGDLVEQRLRDGAVLGDVLHREIVGDRRLRQAQEADRERPPAGRARGQGRSPSAGSRVGAPRSVAGLSAPAPGSRPAPARNGPVRGYSRTAVRHSFSYP